MQTEINRRLPVNFIEEDRSRFAAALKHVYQEPSVTVYQKSLWDVARGKSVKKASLIIRTIVAVLLLKKRVRCAAEVVVATNQYSINYFHWINDVLPCLIYLKSQGLKYPLVVDPFLYKLEFVKSSIKSIDWPVYVCARNTLLFAGKVYKPELTAGEGNQNPLYYLPLKEQLLKLNTEVLGRQIAKVYITRRKAAYRNIFPQQEVEALFEKYGFRIIETDQMTLQEQISLFANCSHLAGAHGAGLTNMTFMKKGSKVLEVRQRNDNHNNCYFAMADTLGLQYYYFLAGGKLDATSVQKDDFVVNLADFEKTLAVFSIS
jgi:capsular polysaccharide biosynthesis protein